MKTADERVAYAMALHEQGYNCAQSVACTFAQDYGFDRETVFRLSEAFGFGLGGMDTCGAVTGMAFVAGMKYSDGNTEEPKSKNVCYAKMRDLVPAFCDRVGSLNCAEIKGKTGPLRGSPLKSCTACIEDAVRIVHEKVLMDDKLLNQP
jgi:C_GCAxxG_C_C family probable redox protein